MNLQFSIGGMTNLTRVHEYADDIARLEDGLSAASYERESVTEICALLEVAGNGFEFALVDEMRKNIEPYAKLWEEVSAWKSSESRWLRDPFHLLQPEVVAQRVSTSDKDVSTNARAFL